MSRVHPSCPSCRCPGPGWHLTVYPPNETLYGRCGTCGQVKHSTELWDNQGPLRDTGYDAERSYHCGCCAHPHNLDPGGHELESRP